MNHMFPSLYTPIKIGSLTLKNRLISSPTSQGDVNADGTLTRHNIAYYQRKAKGGAAVVTIGDGIVHPATGKSHPLQLFLDTDKCIPCLVLCAEAIHQYNALASIELDHGGICCDPAFLGGRRPIGPSSIPVSIGFQTEHSVKTMSEEMTEDLIYEIAESFGSAAARAKKAGFDMCVIHAGHGWLVNQFLSPFTNHRTDKYGGSTENRCRFPLLVINCIRSACGKDFPIEFRISADELIPNGLEINEAIEICKYLEPYVDAFHVSAGVHYDVSTALLTHPSMFLPHGSLVHLAAEVKKAVKIPVITVGGLSNLNQMEEIVASGQADIIAMGRALLADPDLPKKGKAGRPEEIRRCLRCGYCQSCRFTLGTARCTLNPIIGREYETQFLIPSSERKKVVVAGGGPGGMQAAITAAERGHAVTLYEKSGELGGALHFAQFVPYKDDLCHLVTAMKAEISRLPVRVVMNTALTPELVEQEHPDVLIIAIGAENIVPTLPGIDKKIVVMAADVDEGAHLGNNVLVIGGGLVGCETAIDLAQKGRQVTILEMAGNIAGDSNFRHRWAIEGEMKRYGVRIELNKKCISVNDEGAAVINGEGIENMIIADTVVISVGMRPLKDAAEAFRFSAPEFIPIGNCVKAGQVKDAIRAGYDAAISI